MIFSRPLSVILSSCILILFACNSSENTTSVVHQNDTNRPALGHPFGTILKMKIRITDGDEMRRKATMNTFLAKIISVEVDAMPGEILMSLEDETGQLPSNDSELMQLVYPDTAAIVKHQHLKEMVDGYVGKTYDVVAYETGCFGGIPDGYFQYKPAVAGTGFGFSNYLVIIAVVKTGQ